MKTKSYSLIILCVLSSNLFGQKKLLIGIDAGLIMCSAQYDLQTNISGDNQEVWSYSDPNYKIGLSAKYTLVDKHSLISGLNLIHKNLGVNYKNTVDSKLVDFDFYGAFYNVELPLIYNYTITEFKSPDFNISGFIGGAYSLYHNDYTSFFDTDSEFKIEQTVTENHSKWKTNYSFKTGIMSSSYNPKLGHYEFGLSYTYDFLIVRKEYLNFSFDQNLYHADFDIRLSYLSLFFRIYLLDFSIFQGGIHKS